MCAEVLMQMFEKFDLHEVWFVKRSRMFDEYMQNHDSVKLLTYCATFINTWFKRSGVCFRTKNNLPEIGPSNFDVQIMSPDGKTEWTRMAWMIGEFVDYKASFTPEYLLQIEDTLNKKTGIPFYVRKRRHNWQQQKKGTTTAKTNKDDIPIDDLLRNVKRKLDKGEAKDAVSLEVWKNKLDIFCSQFEHQLKGRTSQYYEEIMDLFYELQGQVHHSPDTQKISGIIQEITDKQDKESHNSTFRYHSASRFEFNGEPENIMDILDHLPEELQEMTAPSRARSPSRSPDPSFSPVARPSPQGRHGGGVGGSGRRVNMSGLLHALQALKY